jgi:AraC-like DNA-binding protein
MSACTGWSPFRLEVVQEVGQNMQAADLNRDGIDEIIRKNYDSDLHMLGDEGVLLASQSQGIIDQINIAGQVADSIRVLEYEGVQTLLIPYIRNDSLFVTFARANGKRLLQFFLINGEPRIEQKDTLAWTPEVKQFFIEDLNADGSVELVTVVATGFARLPRGVLVHQLPDGKPMGHLIIGAFPENAYWGKDINSNGKSDLILGTFAPKNGAELGGFDDAHTYTIVVEFNPEPEIIWPLLEPSSKRAEAGVFARTWTTPVDVDQDGRHELLTISLTYGENPEDTRFRLIDPVSWKPFRELKLAEPITHPLLIDMNRDVVPEIVTIRLPGEVWLFDLQFEVKRKRRVAASLWSLHVVPDMDQDGVNEILAVTTNNQVLLLDANLHIKARYDAGVKESGHPQSTVHTILRRGRGNAPYLLIKPQGPYGYVVALRLVRNELYWIYPLLLLIVGLGGILALFIGNRRLQKLRRDLRLQSILEYAANMEDRGLMILDTKKTTFFMNQSLQVLLGFSETLEKKNTSFQHMLNTQITLVDFLHELQITQPPQPKKKMLILQTLDGPETYNASAIPIMQRRNTQVYWFVTLDKAHDEVQRLEYIRMLLHRPLRQNNEVSSKDGASSSKDAVLLEQVHRLIEENLADRNLGVSWLAGALKMDEKTLRRKLRSAADLSPSDYIHMVRLSRAKQLLEKGLAVNAIAREVGMTPDNLTRHFRKVFKVPPSAYPPKPD